MNSRILQGFQHFPTQKEFGNWQEKHPDCAVTSMKPIKNKVLTHRSTSPRYREGYNGVNPIYGIFVTYTYQVKLQEN